MAMTSTTVKTDGSLITISRVKELIHKNLPETDEIISTYARAYSVSEELIWHSLWHNIREMAEMLYMFPKDDAANVFIFHKDNFLNAGFVLGKLIAEGKLPNFACHTTRVFVQTAINTVDQEGYLLSADSYGTKTKKYILKPNKEIQSKLIKATVWIPYCPNRPLTRSELDTLTEKYLLARAKVIIFRPMYDLFEAVPIELWHDENAGERTRILEAEGERLYQEWYGEVGDIIVKKGLAFVDRAQLLREGKLIHAEKTLIEFFSDANYAKAMIDSLLIDLIERFKMVKRSEKSKPSVIPISHRSSTTLLETPRSATTKSEQKEAEIPHSLSDDSVIQGGFEFLLGRNFRKLPKPQRADAQVILAEFMMTYRVVCEHNEATIRKKELDLQT